MLAFVSCEKEVIGPFYEDGNGANGTRSEANITNRGDGEVGQTRGGDDIKPDEDGITDPEEDEDFDEEEDDNIVDPDEDEDFDEEEKGK